ncbi:NAD(P)H-dependent oxidoreductase [Pediococcus parvulus]|uniref:flavodoxin family protein n=1 Tax=Pediococcus parvulus TaxID=54062 RepID=UPI003D032C23
MRKFNIWIALVVLIIGIGIGGVGFSLIEANENSGSSSNNMTVFKSSSNSAKNFSSARNYTNPSHTKKSDKRVFINASMNTDGTTSSMAKTLFGDQSYKQINLASYNIPQVGRGEGDFNRVWKQLKTADVIVIGTPVYWSNMSGYLKTFIDHLQINNDLKNSDLYVIVQGADSDQSVAIDSTYGSLNRVSKRFDLNFVGIAQTDSQVSQLHDKMLGK